MNTRFLVTLLLILLVGTTPIWVYAPAILLSILFFPFYIEAVPLGFIVDVLYFSPVQGGIISFKFGILVSLIILIVLPVRERLRFGY